MANRQRGEVDIEIDGKKFSVCMTLGALAELEDVLGVETAGELDKIIAAPTYKQILLMTHTLANFGGKAEISIDEIRHSSLQWKDAWFGVLDAVKASNPTTGDEGKDESPERKP